MKKRILALLVASMCALSMLACGGAAPAGGDAAPAAAEEPAVDPTSPEAYHAYLHEFVDQCGAIAENQRPEFYEKIDADNFTDFPGDMFFNGMLGANALTYDEFKAANGEYTIPDEIKSATAN